MGDIPEHDGVLVIAVVRVVTGLLADGYVDDRARRIAAPEVSKHLEVGGEYDRESLLLTRGYLECDASADSRKALPHLEEFAYLSLVVSKAAKEHLCDIRVGR